MGEWLKWNPRDLPGLTSWGDPEPRAAKSYPRLVRWLRERLRRLHEEGKT